MLYNKKITLLSIILLSVCSLAPVFAQVGFGDTVSREDSVVVTEESVSPSLLVVNAFAIHIEHHDIVYKEGEGLLSLTQEVQGSIVSDIVSALDQSPNKAEVIQMYLASSDGLLSRGYTALDRAALRIDVLRGLMEACLADKNIADTNFVDAVNNNDDLQAQNALDRSLRASGCATDYRVQLNALQAQYDKLLFYVNILEEKHNYIHTNKENIEQYFFVLKSDLLKELTTITSQLQSFVLIR